MYIRVSLSLSLFLLLKSKVKFTEYACWEPPIRISSLRLGLVPGTRPALLFVLSLFFRLSHIAKLGQELGAIVSQVLLITMLLSLLLINFPRGISLHSNVRNGSATVRWLGLNRLGIN